MPRGGKRPGAGAPRGNFNGVKSGNHSKRMLAVFVALVNHPDKKALARDLYQQGFFIPPRMKFNNDVRGVVTYLWKKWFDCVPAMQSTAISSNHNPNIQPALPGFNTRPETEETKNA